MKQGILDRQARLLLTMHTLYLTSLGLSNTFVSIYFWKIKNDFVMIALYNLLTFSAIPLTFWVAGYMVKHLDRAHSIRIGIILVAVLFALVLLLGNNASHYMLSLGFLLGVGAGFYWLGYDVMYFEITNPSNRDLFNGVNGFLFSTAGMIAPFLSGWLLSNMKNGYTIVFSLSLAIFATAVLASIFIHNRKAEGDFSVRGAWRETRKPTSWHYAMLTHLFWGIREGVILFLVNLLVYIKSSSEFSLGLFVFVTSGVSLAAFYITGKWMAPHKRMRAILIGALMLIAAVLPLFIQVSFYTLLVFGIISSIFFPFFTIPVTSITFDIIGQDPVKAEQRVEYIVMRESALNAGRVISIGCFVIFAMFTKNPDTFPYVLLFVNLMTVACWICMKQIIQNGDKIENRGKNKRMLVKLGAGGKIK